MPFNFKNYIEGVGDSLFNSPTTPNKLEVFGAESNQLAQDVALIASKSFYQSKTQADGFSVANGMVAPVPRSIFNKYALYNFRGMYGDLVGSKPFSSYFDGGDGGSNYLMGGDAAKNISIAKLINFFEEEYPKIVYSPQDFLYGKYYKTIPLNHLITLRRFPIPIEDNIFDLRTRDAKDPQKTTEATQVAGVTAITYLGETAGNKLEDILNFSFGLNWKEITSEMESINTGDGGYTSQPFYSKLGAIGRAGFDTLKNVDSGTKFRKQNDPTTDRLGTTYANFVLGPVNVIDKTLIRDRGIKFGGDTKLTFEYELKSLNYVNPKIAMIDIISNMLTMTTNNGQFFGGGHRYYGSAGFVDNQFGDISKLRNGDFAGYVGSVVSDFDKGFQNLFGVGFSGGSLDPVKIASGIAKGGKNLLGNVLGGFLSSEIGSVSGVGATKAFISGEATGNWHITVGNPLNPIVMMGNMVCDNGTMQFSNELGYDDFPMEVKFELDLKHGKPRDKGDIENMFNAGRGRIYATAAGEEDILNLAGSDVGIYGAVPDAGTSNLQATQSANNNGSPASDLKASNAKSGGVKKNNTTATGEYASNLVDLMIGS